MKIKTCFAFDSSHEDYFNFNFWGGYYHIVTLKSTFVLYERYQGLEENEGSSCV